MSISCTNCRISFYMGIRNLANDISIGYMNYHPVFGCVILIFILDYQVFLAKVISFILSSSSKFHVVSLEVGFTFDNFNKPQSVEGIPTPMPYHRSANPA